MTFHFNPGLDNFMIGDTSVSCASDGNRDPIPNFDHDVVPLTDLWIWANSDVDPLNQCQYGGPIANYDPEEDVRPGSLGAFGIFLHAYEDAFSHTDLINEGLPAHTKHNLATHDLQGFVSGHFAGEFGLNNQGQLGRGLHEDMVTVVTSTGRYKVILHSEYTYEALVQSFYRMVDWLHDPQNPDRLSRYGRPGASVCDGDDIELFAFDFTRIPNYAANEDRHSGARVRSDIADSFFDRANCTWSHGD
jgi:hypothetical protein